MKITHSPGITLKTTRGAEQKNHSGTRGTHMKLKLQFDRLVHSSGSGCFIHTQLHCWKPNRRIEFALRSTELIQIINIITVFANVYVVIFHDLVSGLVPSSELTPALLCESSDLEASKCRSSIFVFFFRAVKYAQLTVAALCMFSWCHLLELVFSHVTIHLFFLSY